MKNTITSLFIISISFAFGQIPQGYYDNATGSGYTLKTQLFNIINGHTDKGYSGLYTTYLNSDRDYFYENDGTMLDVYSENPTGPECAFTYGVNQDDGTLGNNECERYNREHIVPQSVFSSATPMYSDAHFVLPSDKHVNAQRGDLPFGKVNSANWTSTNGTKRGSNLNSGYSAGYSGTVFEPIDEFKGDIARCILYFATRYENVVAGYSYTMFNNTSDQVFTSTFISILLSWNILDPVSPREITRNDAIYARQGNRNPYIDHPEYACQIWAAACSTLATNTFETATISVYPNPTNNHTITIESLNNLDEIQLITINGQILREIKNPVLQNKTYTIDNLQQGFYFLKISSNQQQIIKKILVN